MVGQKRAWGSRAGMGERAYAAHAGISRGAVQKARRSGRLVLHPDGSVDAAASDTRRAEATDPVRSENALMQNEVRAGAGTEAPAEDVPGRANHTTYLEARTAHELLKAEERRIKVGKLRGELVDRALAADLVFRLARRVRDSWLLWPARVAALMVAELGVDAHLLQTVLERHVTEHLRSLPELEPDIFGPTTEEP